MQETEKSKGIYVRIGYPESEVLWLDGHQVVERAYQESFATGDSVSDVLLIRNQVFNLHQYMYNEYGVYQGDKDIRSITLQEAIRFLGRFLQICRFLTTQEEAARFVRLLEEGGDSVERRAAKEIRVLISLLPKRVSHVRHGTHSIRNDAHRHSGAKPVFH
ncbi:MAG: hypothetical protein FWC50_13025 [Planctomycetaceae bacterium]|nr:hypothetical protein [Planctomycetaceae bacterium]